MKGMIFAAGLGTRLQPFTLHHPKALVEVGGKPMLRRVIEKFKDAGVTDIVVNVHHFADQIERYIADNDSFGINISISDERERLLDTGGGIAKAAPLLDGQESILIHNADILTDFDLRRMIDLHEASETDATLLTALRPSSRQLYFNSQNRLVGWQNITTGETRPSGFMPTAEMKPLAFGGVHILSRSMLSALQKWSQSEQVFSIIPFYLALAADKSICAYQPPEEYRWFDIGKPETLEKARRTFA